MSEIRCVFFDLGLTLVHNDLPQRCADSLTRLDHPVSLEQAETAYQLTNRWFMHQRPGDLEKGTPEIWRDYHRMLCAFCGVPGLEEALGEALHRYPTRPVWTVYPETLSVLQQLKEQGYTLGLISNWDRSCRSVLQENGLDRLLDPLIISCEVQAEKPAREIFAAALQRVPFPASECLMVGDNYYSDGLGAAHAGMPYLLLLRNGLAGCAELAGKPAVQNLQEIFTYLKQKENKGKGKV